MTTTVKVHVNGKYKATVKHTHDNGSHEYIVHGNYEGSPNPTGQQNFSLTHPANAKFEITEEPVGDTTVHNLSAQDLNIIKPPGGGC